MIRSLDHGFFRHEYGRLVAVLSRRVGVRHLQAVEDAAQAALLIAVEGWPRDGLPDNPAAWLLRVANNRLLSELQRIRRHGELDRHRRDTSGNSSSPATVHLRGDVQDAVLRMLFVCCTDALPIESQLVLALKVVCGFGVREIAERLFMTEGNVYKRLGRAQERLRATALELEGLTTQELASRLPAVQAVSYLMFTEGYLSSHGETPFRQELCDESKRIVTILANHPTGATPETFALLALMHLHSGRVSARRSATGGLVLLEDQDRSRWNMAEVALGLSWLARSARGNTFSRYHAEAGIAAEHCLAPSLVETRWDRIVECYELLERTAPSMLHTLNRAVAIAEHLGPAEGLQYSTGWSFHRGSSVRISGMPCARTFRGAVAKQKSPSNIREPRSQSRHQRRSPTPSSEDLRLGSSKRADGTVASREPSGLPIRQLVKPLFAPAFSATEANLAHVCRLSADSVLGILDEVTKGLAETSIDPERVHETGLALAREAPDRELVKVGIALAGVVAGFDDLERDPLASVHVRALDNLSGREDLSPGLRHRIDVLRNGEPARAAISVGLESNDAATFGQAAAAARARGIDTFRHHLEWGAARWTPDLRHAVESAAHVEPDAELKTRLERVLSGGPY